MSVNEKKLMALNHSVIVQVNIHGHCLFSDSPGHVSKWEEINGTQLSCDSSGKHPWSLFILR
jgi:hypothetical protein